MKNTSTSKNAIFTFADGELDGASDTVNVELAGNSGTPTLDVRDSTGNNVIETLAISSSGDNSGTIALANNGARAAKTVTVSGEGDLGLGSSGLTGKTFDASAASGDLTVTFGSADQTITGGAGDDELILGSNFGAKDTVDGGQGSDTLSVSSAIQSAGAVGTVSNVETLKQTGTNEVDVNLFSDISLFEAAVSGNTSGTLRFDEAKSGSTLRIVDEMDSSGTSATNVDLDLETDGKSDTGTIELVGNTGSTPKGVNLDDLQADDLETVDITSVKNTEGAHEIDNTLKLTDATSVTLTGAGDTTIAGINLKNADHTFDASAATGDLDLTFDDSQDQTIKTGTGDDKVTISGLDVNDDLDFGAGDDTLVSSISAFPTVVSGSNIEAVELTAGSITADSSLDIGELEGLNELLIDGGGTNLSAGVTVTRIADGVEVKLQDFADTTSEDTVKLSYVAGAAAATVSLEQFGADTGSGNQEDLTIENADAVTLQHTDLDGDGASDVEEVFIDTLNVDTATSLSIDYGVGSGADGTQNEIDIATLTAADLETLTITNDDNNKAINIDSSSTDNSLQTIDASGVDTGTAGEGDLTLGNGSNIIDRADDASVTLGAGDDQLSFDASEHGGNIIDAGDGDDDLHFGGTITGDVVIDLSSSDDQITSLNGVENTASQTGFEDVDASSVTVSTGKFQVTGSSGANEIVGSDAADVISAGGGADTITGGAGADTLTGGTGDDEFNYEAAGEFGDTITDFNVGSATDTLDINVAATAAGFNTESDAAALDFGTNGINVIQGNSSNVASDMTAAEVEAEAISGFTNIGNNEVAYVALTADTDAASDVEIYQVTANGSGDDVASVAHVVTLAGVIADSITTADFETLPTIA